ncbi:MAG: hypothetical protein M3Y35_18225, partial [Actinomycetota bacterium]|nr:hypothetical protein [Actinomycetota bacterium]
LLDLDTKIRTSYREATFAIRSRAADVAPARSPRCCVDLDASAWLIASFLDRRALRAEKDRWRIRG